MGTFLPFYETTISSAAAGRALALGELVEQVATTASYSPDSADVE